MARLWSKQFLSYLAGFVDGEGTIGVYKRKKSIHHNGISFNPYLAISNSNLQVLEYIAEQIGFGSVRNKKTISGHFGKKPVYSYWISNANSRKVIRAIHPYLIVKKEQAKLILEMPKRGGTYNPESEKLRREEQEKVYLKIKEIQGYKGVLK